MTALCRESNMATPTGGEKESFNLVIETVKLFHIGIPSVAVQFNLYVIFPITASAVGKTLGAQDLAAFSLGSLVGSLTCLSVIVGSLSAADTLMPRAYGSGHYDEIGQLAIRSFVVCGAIMLPLLVALSQATWIESLLSSLGQDATVSAKAATWIQIYLIGVPPNILLRIIQRFCVAQHRPWPPVAASIMPSVIMFQFLVQRCIHWFGFLGSAIAIVTCQWMMCFMLLLHMRIFRGTAYVSASWPGMSLSYLRESLALEPMKHFLHLSLGGVAALSEWWFWECMCLVAGTFGVVELCAHSIAYNIIPLCFMLPLGMSIGLSVRMGAVLAYDPSVAKKMAAYTLLLAAIAGVLMSILLYMFRMHVIELFTSDPDVRQQCLTIWGRVCCYVVVLYVFGINGAILRALGLQWTMAAALGGTLWAAALPTILWISVHNEGGLVSQWTLLPIFYMLLQLLLASCYTSFDWEARRAQIQPLTIHQLMDNGNGEEQLPLLPAAGIEVL
ncbi:hypothetical protein MPSEU_000487100 [Mayamaea pseudoterrestris]|nr:hypothetical protein MPSEU_000487100 [Mayamaea pseudoterrestris]